MITPSQIKERSLSTAQAGGYNKQEVNELLVEIIDSYEAVFQENKELYRKMEVLATRIEEYRSEEDSIKTALITAQKMADRITKEAKEDAEIQLSESAQTAQKTVLTAKEKADKMISESRNYASSFTQEKQKAAESIINEAESKANEVIESSKVVAQNILNQAKELSAELIEKAKSEKQYHDDIVARLQDESAAFKNSLIELYESQISRMSDLVDFSVNTDNDDKKIQAAEQEINQIISNIDEINKLQADTNEDNSDDEELEENSSEDDEELVSEIEEIEEEIIEVQEEDLAEETEISEIIDEASEETEDDTQEIVESSFEIVEEDDEDISVGPESVFEAIDAFSANEITPLENGGTYISEIDEEPEMEAVDEQEMSLFDEPDEPMPFENYFNVKKEDGRSDETISLIPPDDFEDDEDENPKFKGFFKKKK